MKKSKNISADGFLNATGRLHGNVTYGGGFSTGGGSHTRSGGSSSFGGGSVQAVNVNGHSTTGTGGFNFMPTTINGVRTVQPFGTNTVIPPIVPIAPIIPVDPYNNPYAYPPTSGGGSGGGDGGGGGADGGGGDNGSGGGDGGDGGGGDNGQGDAVLQAVQLIQQMAQQQATQQPVDETPIIDDDHAQLDDSLVEKEREATVMNEVAPKLNDTGKVFYATGNESTLPEDEKPKVRENEVLASMGLKGITNGDIAVVAGFLVGAIFLKIAFTK